MGGGSKDDSMNQFCIEASKYMNMSVCTFVDKFVDTCMQSSVYICRTHKLGQSHKQGWGAPIAQLGECQTLE